MSMILVAILLTALITFFSCSLFGYVIHRAIHQKWTGPLNKSHMTHHLKLYPITDYTSDIYRQAGKDDTFKIFAVAAVPVVATPIILGIMGIISLPLTITSLIVMGLMGFLHSYIHDSFHIRNHYLNRVPVLGTFFKHWNSLHFLHHVNMQTNFGIFTFHWDRIFGTFWKQVYHDQQS
jgi:sterol desaturase/sphingolipid hydroxylase (fatty acid hydroxylase superfamily)